MHSDLKSGNTDELPSIARESRTHNNSTQPDDGLLVVPEALWGEVLAHLRSGLPNESCGLLAGPATDGATGPVTTFYPGTNVLASPVRYRMDSAQLVAAVRSMREGDLVLRAIVHSHPLSAPEPSHIDLAEANYPDAAMVIVSFRFAEPEAAAWRLDGLPAAPLRRIALRIGAG